MSIVNRLAAIAAVTIFSASSVYAQSEQTYGVTDSEVRIGAFGPFGGAVYLYGK